MNYYEVEEDDYTETCWRSTTTSRNWVWKVVNFFNKWATNIFTIRTPMHGVCNDLG